MFKELFTESKDNVEEYTVAIKTKLRGVTSQFPFHTVFDDKDIDELQNSGSRKDKDTEVTKYRVDYLTKSGKDSSGISTSTEVNVFEVLIDKSEKKEITKRFNKEKEKWIAENTGGDFDDFKATCTIKWIKGLKGFNHGIKA